MQLSRQADYAFRLLIHLSELPEQRVSIASIAEAQGISRANLMKIASVLASAGIIVATRGRNGGISLAREPNEISMDEVLRAMNPAEKAIDCNRCQLIARCKIPAAISKLKADNWQNASTYRLSDLIL